MGMAGTVLTQRMSNWRLWQPPSETIEAIAGVLRAHWATAKSLQPQGLFWARPASWLRRQATSLVASAATRPAPPVQSARDELTT